MHLSRALLFYVLITKPVDQRLSKNLSKMPGLSVLVPTEEVDVPPPYNPHHQQVQDPTVSEGEPVPAVPKIYPDLPLSLPGWLSPPHTQRGLCPTTAELDCPPLQRGTS